MAFKLFRHRYFPLTEKQKKSNVVVYVRPNASNRLVLPNRYQHLVNICTLLLRRIKKRQTDFLRCRSIDGFLWELPSRKETVKYRVCPLQFIPLPLCQSTANYRRFAYRLAWNVQGRTFHNLPKDDCGLPTFLCFRFASCARFCGIVRLSHSAMWDWDVQAIFALENKRESGQSL
jgi:hypothetical protein